MQSAVKRSLLDLAEEEVAGRCALVRIDANVPLKGGQITDDTRLRKSLPTIRFLSFRGAKVILCSHLGRPKGLDQRFSLARIAAHLSSLLEAEVAFVGDCIGTEIQKEAAALKPGQILMLENTRFHEGETSNDLEFAAQLAAPADFFVMDAFGCAHRAHASTAGVAQFLSPVVAGLLLQKELSFLNGAMTTPARPFVAVVGGSKVSSKIGVLESLLAKCNKLIIGGGMVFTFLAARGLPVGASLVEADKIDVARQLEALAAACGVQLLLPQDIVVAERFAQDAPARVVAADAIPDGWLGLDIGPKSLEAFRAALADARTVLWNGPMGVFEWPRFATGTLGIAHALAELTEKGCTTIIGGGDSVCAVEQAGLAGRMSHISTGGGASLELLEGRTLPGVAALDARAPPPAGALVLLGQFIYFWTFGVLFSAMDWLVHHEAPVVNGSADKPGRAAMLRSNSRTQLAGV
ncbi:hypothetical protein WJX81_001493 [Elliptochloris bilobata]|uniref:Phosphoglycerate kinase n=1 Tax=Elliptochloris bilobata TaxID=381761 RepID=A0AAW1QZA2_9CHLO